MGCMCCVDCMCCVGSEVVGTRLYPPCAVWARKWWVHGLCAVGSEVVGTRLARSSSPCLLLLHLSVNIMVAPLCQGGSTVDVTVAPRPLFSVYTTVSPLSMSWPLPTVSITPAPHCVLRTGLRRKSTMHAIRRRPTLSYARNTTTGPPCLIARSTQYHGGPPCRNPPCDYGSRSTL